MYIHNLVYLLKNHIKSNKMKKLLTLILICFGTVVSAQIPNYVPSNGLVGWWPFNGNANDESGNGNHGTVNGATLATDRNGNVNSAYSFDGVNDKIEVQDNSSLNLENGTINLWYKTTSNDRMTLFNKSNFNDASNENYTCTIGYLYSVNGPTGISYAAKYNSNCMPSNGWVTPINSLNFSDGTYHMLTCKTGQNSIEIYVDAILQSTIVTPNLQADVCSGSNLRFGVNWIGDLNYYFGEMDDIGIWNRELSQCEISDLFNSQLGSLNSYFLQNENSINSYTWPVNGQTYTQSGTYTDTLVNAVGCDSIVTLQLTMQYTGIDEQGLWSTWISPNPVKDEFSIVGTEPFLSMNLKDVHGNDVKSFNVQDKTHSLSMLPSGIYFLELRKDSKTFVVKLLKE